MGLIQEVVIVDPMCQIRSYSVSKSFGSFTYAINGFIDMDGSYGMNGHYLKFSMKDKSFTAFIKSRNELVIQEGMNFRFSEMYVNRFT